jgi:adenylosuccinate lyase
MECPRHETYVSPFSSRYSSREMHFLHSAQYRSSLFRKLWIALAKAQQKLGLNITDAQIRQMQNAVDSIDFNTVKKYEKKFRHDVMAHLYAYGEQCPKAKPILHLGATSCYVTDNADLIILWESLYILYGKLVLILKKMGAIADKTKNIACLGYTHLQPAQPTTVGKRMCLWLQDFLYDLISWEHYLLTSPFLGAKGATGTQSSFLCLFEGNEEKVKKLDEWIAAFMGFEKPMIIASQTYTRKWDLLLLNSLEAFAASAHKMATDLRLLSHMGEIREKFSKSQIGSSAMPYKQNPIYSERICGLSRFLISLSQNPVYTAATQWLERSLDDSSNRRFSLSEAFLSADAILNLLYTVVQNLQIDPSAIKANLEQNLAMIVMENILMAAVRKGGDRQKLHEKLRVIATQSKDFSAKNSIDKIEKDKSFSLSKKELGSLMQIKSCIGRAPSQVAEFLKEELHPALSRFKGTLPKMDSIEV